MFLSGVLAVDSRIAIPTAVNALWIHDLNFYIKNKKQSHKSHIYSFQKDSLSFLRKMRPNSNIKLIHSMYHL